MRQQQDTPSAPNAGASSTGTNLITEKCELPIGATVNMSCQLKRAEVIHNDVEILNVDDMS